MEKQIDIGSSSIKTFTILVVGIAMPIVFAVFINIWYLKSERNNDRSHEQLVINKWGAILHQDNLNIANIKDVLIGVNTNVDLIVSGLELLKLQQSPCTTDYSVDHPTHLNALYDLQQIFSYYFHRGHAAERHCFNKQFFTDLVQAASKIHNAQWFIGGNAALMAETIVNNFDARVKLIGPVGDRLKGLLNESITIPHSSRYGRDEVHLIMEYQVGDMCESYITPIANRFILTHDEINSELSLINELFNQLPSNSNSSTANVDLLVLSGLHFLDALPERAWMERCDTVSSALQAVPSTVASHVELASMTTGDVVLELTRRVLPHADSMGLNEQELAFISHVAGGPHAGLHGRMQGQPPVHQVADILYWLLTSGASGRRTRLSRVHFHTLTYHVIAVDESRRRWARQLASVVSGAAVAGRQACQDERLVADKLELRLGLPEVPHQPYTEGIYERYESVNDSLHPVLTFRREHVAFYLTPVLVCRKPVKTVGLGDAISATGLLTSHFIPRG